MKKLLLFSAALFLLAMSCNEPEEVFVEEPRITQVRISQVNDRSAQAVFQTDCEEEDAVLYVCYSTNPEPTLADDNLKGDGEFEVTGLSPATEYYIRGCVQTSGTEFYGPQTKFTTARGCRVTDVTVVAVTGTKATMRFSVTGGDIKEAGICWERGADPAIECKNSIRGEFAGSGMPVEVTIDNIEYETSYYARGWALTKGGERIYSAGMTQFSSWLGCTPGFSLKVVGVNEIEASVEYEVNVPDKYRVVERGVCWSRHDEPTVNDNFLADGSETGLRQLTIEGLSPGTAYTVRPYVSVSRLYPGGDAYSDVLYGSPVEVMTWEKDKFFDIPDDRFREALLKDNHDKDRDGMISREEAAAVTYLSVGGQGIRSLEGIEYFTNLRTLYCYNNYLFALDLSHNTALVELDCGSNSLSALDLSAQTQLEKLICSDNQLREVIIGSPEKLRIFSASDNALSELKFDETYLSLEEVWVSNNWLKKVELSGCLALHNLSCDYNDIEELIIGDLPSLEQIVCRYNILGELDLAGAPNLLTIACDYNRLENLDISHNPLLSVVSCKNNYIKEIDASANSQLYNYAILCDPGVNIIR